MAKVAARLQRRVRMEPPTTAVVLHVLLRKDDPAAESDRITPRIRALAPECDSCEWVPLVNGLICSGTLALVSQLEDFDEVVWIDEEHTAPLEKLLDE